MYEVYGAMSFPVRLTSCLFILFAALLTSAASFADDDPVFVITFADGKIDPQILEVPANRRFKLILKNEGTGPVEFESNELRREKVLAGGTTSFIVIRRLDPGEYKFFDDFHLDTPPATLIAKDAESP
jgi:hypothetical protein